MHTFYIQNQGNNIPAGWTTRIDLRGGLNSGTLSVASSSGAAYAASLALWCIVGNKNSGISTDEKTWSFSRNFTQKQNAVVWSSSASLFVSVGEAGSIYTSSDGVNWFSQTNPLGTSDIMTSITYSSSLNLFVATAYAGKIITSTNGTSWTQRTPASGVGYLNTVCWSSTLSLFLYAGMGDTGNTGSLGTSPDGITWTARTGISTCKYGCSVYSTTLSLFVIGGTNSAESACKMAYSSDGITWTDVVTPGSGTKVYSLAEKAGTFFSGRGSGYAYTSTDGSTWSSATTNCLYPIRSAVAATTGDFIFSTDYEINLDTDYPIWLQPATGRMAYDSAGNVYLIAGKKGTVIFSTDNGITWEFYNIGTAQDLKDAASVDDTSVAYDYGLISSDTLYYANSGSINSGNWATTALAATLNSITNNAGYNRNVIASTSSNKIYYSSNESMSGFSSGTSVNPGTSIACFGKGQSNHTGVYYALAANTALYYSSAEPPTTWTLLIAADSNNKTFISKSGYAVGSTGRIQKVNGSAWSTLTSGTTNTLTAIDDNSSVYIAVGASDTIKKSTDGTSWSSSTAPAITGIDYKGVIFGNDKVVAYGQNSLSELVLITSPDGL